MKITKVLGLVVLVGALVAGLVLVKRNQETRRGAAYAEIEALFLPDAKSVKIGDEITSTFVLDTKTHKLTGVDVRIKYDATKLTAKEVNPVIVGGTAGAALFRAESDVLSKSIDDSKGLITLAGISMEEDTAKMATGAVSLVKIVFGAKTAGSAQVTLDGAYDNMATGYNPSSSDQSLAIKTVKPATYTISSTVSPTVTKAPTSTIKPTVAPTKVPTSTVKPTVAPTATKVPTKVPTSTIKPTVVPTGTLSCKWCGTSCVSSVYKGACLDVMPPAGQKCTVVNGECKVVSTTTPTVTKTPTVIPTVKPKCGWCGNNCQIITSSTRCIDVAPPVGKYCVEASGGVCRVIYSDPTPTGSLGCGQRCTINTKCGNGLTCVPIWWPSPCGEIPSPLLDKTNNNQALSTSDVSTAVRICPEVKNALLPESERDKINTDGSVRVSIAPIAPPAMIGVCRNPRCTTDTDCVCGGMVTPTRVITMIPTVKPTVTGTAKCSCPAGVPAKREGNANCDDRVSALDFEVWRSEAFDQGGIEGKMRTDWKADFNCDQKVNLSDFEMWRARMFDVKVTVSADETLVPSFDSQVGVEEVQ